MTIIVIEVSSATAAWLEREARVRGLATEAFAAVVLEDAAKNGTAPMVDGSRLSPRERLRRFDADTAKVPARPGPPVDASRESIYD